MKNTFLISVSLSWNLKRIDNYAFEGCNAIRVVSCNTYAPPVCRAYFSTGTTKDGTLVVPVGSKTDYEMTGGWKDFKNIIESSAGIAESEADVAQRQQSADWIMASIWYTSAAWL